MPPGTVTDNVLVANEVKTTVVVFGLRVLIRVMIFVSWSIDPGTVRVEVVT